MTKGLIKEQIISSIFGSPIFEEGPTGGNQTSSDSSGNQKKSEEPSAAPAAPVNDPDKDAANPEIEDLASQGYAEYESLLFLVSKDDSGIVKKGENLGFIELTRDTLEKQGKEVDLEDFQWWCPADEFEAYLNSTGRKYNKSSGEWTSEGEEFEESEIPKNRKIRSYSDFLNEKEEALNEITGIPFIGNIGPSVTSKGMAWSGEDPNFEGGKLSKKQREFIKFFFTRNKLKNEGKIEYELNLNDLKRGEKIEIFACPYDPKTKKSYPETSVIGLTYRVESVIPKSGDLNSTIVIGVIERIAPNIEVEKKSAKSILDLAVIKLGGVASEFEKLFSSSFGMVAIGLIAVSSITTIGGGLISGAGGLLNLFFNFRTLQGLSGIRNAMGAGKTARAAKNVGMSKGIFNFVKYPFSAGRRLFRIMSTPLKARKYISGWKAVRYVVFGSRIAKGAKYLGVAGKLGRGIGAAGKITNPVGWVLLAADAIGSFMNYTSDNQAPSWDPIVGGEGDSMKDYSGEGNTCPHASNSFSPQDIKNGQTITLCWTENPKGGFGAALSFVYSNSTRTTMNITKILDWDNRKISMFFINSVNSKEIWDEISGFDIRFIFINHGKYEEGWADDNIGAYYICGKAPSGEENVIPLAYDGHCDFELFKNEYRDSKDQLVIISDKWPKEYNFHFEDRESNVINVYGRLITDKDIEQASEKDIESYFNVEPVSSSIGNPDTETEEEKNQRKSLESISKSQGKEESEEENNPEEETENKNESEDFKWYSSINESGIISDFNHFKSIKNSIFEDEKEKTVGGYVDDAISSVKDFFGGEEKKEEPKKEEPKEKTGEEKENEPTLAKIGSMDMVSSTSEFDENFKKVLNGITKPMDFGIYFVDLREYADPKLRNLYKPGSFMNFSLKEEAFKISDGGSLEGLIQVNNLDVLLDVKKGIYTYSEGEEEEVSARKPEEEQVKSSDTIRTSYIGKEKQDIGKIEQIKQKEPIETINRVDPSVLADLDITEWNDVTNIKVIRSRDGEIKSIKIKNSRANLGDKSRKIDVGDSNFESAKKLLDAYQDKKTEEEEEKNKSQER